MARSMNKPREKNIYVPGSTVPHRLSRFRISMFEKCRRCFYHYSRDGIKDPEFERGGNLYQVMDRRWKVAMDRSFAERKPHPVLQTHGLDLLPFRCPEFPRWRDTMEGATYLHKETNFLVQGIIDDLWIDVRTGLLRVVDFKTTTIEDPATMTKMQKKGRSKKQLQDDLELWDSYRRQIEVYQWIFRQKQYDVLNTGHFVLAKVREDLSSESQLRFDHVIKDHEGDDRWVEPKLHDIKACLESNDYPPANPICKLCKVFDLRMMKYQEKAQANAMLMMMQMQQQYRNFYQP